MLWPPQRDAVALPVRLHAELLTCAHGLSTCCPCSQSAAAGAAGRLSAAQVATVAAATQKGIADALAFPFQIATSAFEIV